MANIVLGCDSNGNDKACQDTVAEILEKAGHKVEKLPIAPGPFAKYSYSAKAKGKIGVYLMAASLVSVVDAYSDGIQFKYCYFGIRGDVSKLINSVEDLKTKKIPKDHHGDCTTSLCDKWAGKTYAEINEIAKSKLNVTAGKNNKELGNNLVSAIGGESTDSSSKETGSDSASSVRESIQKLLKHWDGDVECRIVDDMVYINKIPEPESTCNLLLQEGVNVFSDSISVTDVNPDTPNYLVVHWSEGKIIIKDEDLIKRFGEIRTEVNAVKKVNKVVSSKKSNSKTNDKKSNDDDKDNTNDNNDNVKTSVVEVPIKKYKEALSFANTEWHKIKRDNGHTIECQVAGSSEWRVGKWVRTVLPSFDENDYMYIIRVSQSDDGGDWTCNLTLVDYPPGWGVEETESNSSGDSSSSGSKDASSVINTICKEIGKFSYSHSCSDGDCIKSSKKGDCWALSDYIYKRLKKEGISAKIYQYKTSGSNQHRQVKYQDGSKWVMFPYSKSGIDHTFYTNSIPEGAKPL